MKKARGFRRETFLEIVCRQWAEQQEKYGNDRPWLGGVSEAEELRVEQTYGICELVALPSSQSHLYPGVRQAAEEVLLLEGDLR